jgi:hypothetical protein
MLQAVLGTDVEPPEAARPWAEAAAVGRQPGWALALEEAGEPLARPLVLPP